MNYYFSQQDSRWANMLIGKTHLNMKNFGCMVTDCAMVLSYHLGREVTPKEFLEYCNQNDGFTSDGLLRYAAVVKFSNNTLRFSYKVDPANGDRVYGIRKVNIYRGHWVFDHPIQPEGKDKIIDPLDGKVKPYNFYQGKYANINRFFMGKPMEQPQRYPVDDRYGLSRNWVSEQKFAWYWLPGSPAKYIKSKIGRGANPREVKALCYGHWDFEAVYRNRVGDEWLFKQSK